MELNDAAAAALWMLSRQQDNSREHIGLLYDEGGEIQRTPTQTMNRRNETRGSFSIPRGSLRGIFHNHPEDTSGRTARRHQDRQKFSAMDVEQANRLGVPSYIDAGGNRYRKYEPRGATQAVYGDDFLARFPMDEFRAYLMKKLLDRAPDDERGLMR